jgi:hypothetical protein
LSADHVRAILPSNFLPKLEAVDPYGAHGDPALTGDVVQILRDVCTGSPDCQLTL